MHTANDLVGAWRLESWSLIYEDGREPEYPLGTDAVGMIMDTPDGHVSAMLTRAGRGKAAPVAETEKAAAYAATFAYAGRFEVRDGTVHHGIDMALNPALVGLVAARDIELVGDRLTLSGADFAVGAKRTQRIAWRRAPRR